MNILTISIGILIVIFGLYTFYVRMTSPEKFSKLQVMQDKFGFGVATVIHTIAYSILPLILGGMIIHAGLNGASIMQFFAS